MKRLTGGTGRWRAAAGAAPVVHHRSGCGVGRNGRSLRELDEAAAAALIGRGGRRCPTCVQLQVAWPDVAGDVPATRGEDLLDDCSRPGCVAPGAIMDKDQAVCVAHAPPPDAARWAPALEQVGGAA